MRTFQEYIADEDLLDSSLFDDLPLEERFVSAAIVATKLASLKKQIANEEDIRKQNMLLSRMMLIGFGTIALVVNELKKKR